MPRDYKNARRESQPSRSSPPWLWLLAGLAIGLFVTFLLQLREPPSSSEQTAALPVPSPQPSSVIPQTPAPSPPVQRDKPASQDDSDTGTRFEYYTILPETEGQGTESKFLQPLPKEPEPSALQPEPSEATKSTETVPKTSIPESAPETAKAPPRPAPETAKAPRPAPETAKAPPRPAPETAKAPRPTPETAKAPRPAPETAKAPRPAPETAKTTPPQLAMAKPSPKPAEILPRAKEPAAKTPAYVLQVGSFRRLEDADSLKAKLALIGLNAKIQSVPVNSEETWHRVRLGPYKDSSALQEARKRLQSNGMQAIVLK